MSQAGWRLAVKRALDIVVAVVGLLAASPVLLVAWLAVRIALGKPVLFWQSRPGRGGKLFSLVKFRTMREAFALDGAELPDAQRMTRLGVVLRATSIDELPQLWNVLRGDISLVGPRPLLVRYLPRYSAEQARRHEVFPGITGWAQVNGRNAISWEQRFALDVWYVDHWSLSLDLRILALTMARVLLRSGVAAEGHATMPEFEGTPKTKEQR